MHASIHTLTYLALLLMNSLIRPRSSDLTVVWYIRASGLEHDFVLLQIPSGCELGCMCTSPFKYFSWEPRAEWSRFDFQPSRPSVQVSPYDFARMEDGSDHKIKDEELDVKRYLATSLASTLIHHSWYGVRSDEQRLKKTFLWHSVKETLLKWGVETHG